MGRRRTTGDDEEGARERGGTTRGRKTTTTTPFASRPAPPQRKPIRADRPARNRGRALGRRLAARAGMRRAGAGSGGSDGAEEEEVLLNGVRERGPSFLSPALPPQERRIARPRAPLPRPTDRGLISTAASGLTDDHGAPSAGGGKKKRPERWLREVSALFSLRARACLNQRLVFLDDDFRAGLGVFFKREVKKQVGGNREQNETR